MFYQVIIIATVLGNSHRHADIMTLDEITKAYSLSLAAKAVMLKVGQQFSDSLDSATMIQVRAFMGLAINNEVAINE